LKIHFLQKKILLYLFFLKKHAATFSDNIFAKTGTRRRITIPGSKALTILTLFAFFSLLLVNNFHIGFCFYVALLVMNKKSAYPGFIKQPGRRAKYKTETVLQNFFCKTVKPLKMQKYL